MKSFIKMVFAGTIGTFIGFALIIFLGLATLILISSFTASQFGNAKIEPNSVLFLPLRGELVERKGNMFLDWEEDSPFYRGPRHVGLWEIERALEKAQSDSRIRGVYIKMGPLSAGWASLGSLVQALSDFKKNGKFIQVYSENFDEKTYYVASVADKIHGYPEGSFEFNGLASVPLFLKGSLEKMGVKPEIFRVGEFKSAVEIFTQEKMSEESRQQNSILVEDLWSHYLSDLKLFRGQSPEFFNQIASQLEVTKMSQALERKMIDQASSEEEVLDLLKGLTDTPRDKKLGLVSYGRYQRQIDAQNLLSSKPKIAVIFVNGEIISGSSTDEYVGSEDLIASLRQIARDKDIKSLVLRVNSPGGSALAADVIWRQILELKKTKPVVASFGDMAASGGYYIAAGADYIFSSPSTVTGSIGVFGVMFNTQALFNQKLGVTFDRVVSHPHADLGDMTREMSTEEKQKIQSEVEQTYQQFLRVVQQGRNFKTINEADKVARGRVWSGAKAQELGLVDEFGDLSQAIEKAAELAKIEDAWDIQIFPKEKSPFEQIIQAVGEMSIFRNLALPLIGSREELKSLKSLLQLKEMGRVLAIDPQSPEIK